MEPFLFRTEETRVSRVTIALKPFQKRRPRDSKTNRTGNERPIEKAALDEHRFGRLDDFLRNIERKRNFN